MVIVVVDGGAGDRGFSDEGGIGGGKSAPVGIGIGLSKLELLPDKRPFRR